MTTINNNLIDLLATVGLHENAARVYIAALELGPSSIWEIAKKSGVKRPTCYVILEELAIKGFASSNNDGKRVNYSVIRPKQLLLHEERLHSRFKEAGSQLMAIASLSKEKPKIRTYEGAEGIRKVYAMAADEPRGTDFYILGANMLETEYVEVITEEIIRRNKKGILTRGIFPDNQVNREMRLERSPIEKHNNRFIPEAKFSPKTQILIFGNTVAYLAHTESEPFATVIESAALAHDEKERFELLWAIAEK
jgi:sugar-specific transcriptional regulator TrmB